MFFLNLRVWKKYYFIKKIRNIEGNHINQRTILLFYSFKYYKIKCLRLAVDATYLLFEVRGIGELGRKRNVGNLYVWVARMSEFMDF